MIRLFIYEVWLSMNLPGDYQRGKMQKIIRLVCLLAILVSVTGAQTHSAQAQKFRALAPYGFEVEPVATGLFLPTSFAFAPGNRIYITEKYGMVRTVRDGVLQEKAFFNLSKEVNTHADRGLLGIATFPQFASNPYVYLAYVYNPSESRVYDESGARVSRVLRVSANPNNYDVYQPGSEMVLLGKNSNFANIGNPAQGDKKPYSCQDAAGNPVVDCFPEEGTAHQINHMIFGSDGSLFVASGDGINYSDGSLRAQDLNRLSGKVLRVNPFTGAGYANNPYFDGDVNSNRSKVWLYGMRNPFRIALSPFSGNLMVAEVGNNKWEEITEAGKGANLGWPCFEGPVPNAYDPICQPVLNGTSAVISPTYSYPHSAGRGAAIGGDFVTNRAWPGQYRNSYYFADFNVGIIYQMSFDGAGRASVSEFITVIPGPVQVSYGPDGNLYVLSVQMGTLYRIRWTGVAGLPAPTPTRKGETTTASAGTPVPGATAVPAAKAPAAGAPAQASKNANPDIATGKRVKIRNGYSISVRSKPGADAGRELGVMGGGEQAIVIGGPEAIAGDGDTIIWWYVRTDSGIEGWVPANTAEAALLQPLK